MSLTKEQLLIPRYLCTGTPGKILMPGYTFAHGNIVEPDEAYPKWFFDDFPHLFKPLPWWYGRKPEEMPEYVNVLGDILKVVCYYTQNQWPHCLVEDQLNNRSKALLINCTPATEQEYKDYQKQKEG